MILMNHSFKANKVQIFFSCSVNTELKQTGLNYFGSAISVEQIHWNNCQICTQCYVERDLTGKLLKDYIYIHMSVRSQSKHDFPQVPIIMMKEQTCEITLGNYRVILLAWIYFSVYYVLQLLLLFNKHRQISQYYQINFFSAPYIFKLSTFLTVLFQDK